MTPSSVSFEECVPPPGLLASLWAGSPDVHTSVSEAMTQVVHFRTATSVGDDDGRPRSCDQDAMTQVVCSRMSGSALDQGALSHDRLGWLGCQARKPTGEYTHFPVLAPPTANGANSTTLGIPRDLPLTNAFLQAKNASAIYGMPVAQSPVRNRHTYRVDVAPAVPAAVVAPAAYVHVFGLRPLLSCLHNG